MDFKLSVEQQMLKRTVRDFAEKVIGPIARECDEKEECPVNEIIKKLSNLNLIAPTLPTKFGGAGLDQVSFMIITEEFARVDGGIANVVAGLGFGTEMIAEYGTEDQKEKYLPPVTKGEKITGFAVTEPEVGSDIASLRTRAVKDGDYYIINGNKMFISNGSIADFLVIATKTEPEMGHRGITMFLVETDTAGFIANPLKGKMGVRALDVAEISLDDVKVPKENIIGQLNQGFYQIMEFLGHERIMIAALAVGIAQGAFEEAFKYSREREQFGRPISDFQAIQFKLADMYTKIEAARLLTYKAASLAEEGKRGSELSGPSSVAKLYASEIAEECASEATQIHGGYGIMKEFPVERYYRDAKITKIYEGTSDVQRLVIARWLLKR